MSKYTYSREAVVESAERVEAKGRLVRQYLNKADNSVKIDGFRLGLVQHLGLVESTRANPGLKTIAKQFGLVEGFAVATLKRYLVTSPMAVTILGAADYAEDETIAADLATYLTGMSQQSGPFGGYVPADEHDEIAANIAAYILEGLEPLEAAKQVAADRTEFLAKSGSENQNQNEDEDGDEGSVPGNNSGDVTAAGDPGEVTPTEALEAAVRFLNTAKDAIAAKTPTERRIFQNVIAEAWAVVEDLTDLMDAK